MFYFCRMWAGISSRSGLNASLSHYKDRYIIERGIETEMRGMTDVRLWFRLESKPLRPTIAHH